jgi:peptidoglycan/xylan/chitin deacetylase (PgdA/CDA1 family)
MDKHGIKLSSFMIGKAVETSPDLAREIVRRGHEAAAHGRVWDNSYRLSRDMEKRFIADSVETIQKITGERPLGWNAYWMRNSIHILETLQDLGFLYHIDEPSHDEPFIIPVRGRDFVTVPYTFHMNDIVSFPFERWNPAAYEQALRDEFDQLYEEGAHRRRMMVVSLHDRISGTPAGFAPSTASSPTQRARRASGSLARTRLPAGRSIIAPTRPSSSAARRT